MKIYDSLEVYRAIRRQLLELVDDQRRLPPDKRKVQTIYYAAGQLIVGWEFVQPGLGLVVRHAWAGLYHDETPALWNVRRTYFNRPPEQET